MAAARARTAASRSSSPPIKKGSSLFPDWETADRQTISDWASWVRLALGFVLGIAAGVLQVRGIVGVCGGIALLAFLPLLWTRARGVELEAYYESIGPFFQEGFMPAFATFTLLWIIAFNVAPIS
jgi:hypothetical protein